jgi:hypothetical protein
MAPAVTVVFAPAGKLTSAHGSTSARFKADRPPLSLISPFVSSYLPRSTFAHAPSVTDAFPDGSVRYRSGCATGLFVRLRPRHT